MRDGTSCDAEFQPQLWSYRERPLPGKFKSSISANPSKSSFVTQVPILTRDPSELDVAEPGVVVSATVGWILDGVNDVDPRTFDGKASVPRALIVQPSAKSRTFREGIRCSTIVVGGKK